MLYPLESVPPRGWGAGRERERERGRETEMRRETERDRARDRERQKETQGYRERQRERQRERDREREREESETERGRERQREAERCREQERQRGRRTGFWRSLFNHVQAQAKSTIVLRDSEDALGLTAADDHGAPNLDGVAIPEPGRDEGTLCTDAGGVGSGGVDRIDDGVGVLGNHVMPARWRDGREIVTSGKENGGGVGD